VKVNTVNSTVFHCFDEECVVAPCSARQWYYSRNSSRKICQM